VRRIVRFFFFLLKKFGARYLKNPLICADLVGCLRSACLPGGPAAQCAAPRQRRSGRWHKPLIVYTALNITDRIYYFSQ
jgi:hypothetical protein